MKSKLGIDSGPKARGEIVPVVYDTSRLANGHALVVGMSGAGKSFLLRKMIADFGESSSVKLRVHVLDPHGDMFIDGASSVRFSEQTKYGMNPLRVNPDPHDGGLRRRVQGFIATMNRVMRQLGGKQEACLRNILYDLYSVHGFNQDNPETWLINDAEAHLISDGSDNRLYLNIPRHEKDQAKAVGNIIWDREKFLWWIKPDEYKGAITNWPVKTAGRTHPSIQDALVFARRILERSFLGSDQEAIIALEAFNRATGGYQKKVLEKMRRGGVDNADDEKAQADLEKAATKAKELFSEYVDKIKHGREVTDLMKYDSVDVLKSVVDRLENLNAIGIFQPTPAPFDDDATVWHYNMKSLSMEERKLFGLFKMEEIFTAAVQRGEQTDVVEVIVLDEAHIYSDADPDNIMNNIATEARKFGLALICASQSPTHFPEAFIGSVATKIILGIDEQYWRQSAIKMNVSEEAIKWIKLQQSMLVQLKEKGSAKSDWRWTYNS